MVRFSSKFVVLFCLNTRIICEYLATYYLLDTWYVVHSFCLFICMYVLFVYDICTSEEYTIHFSNSHLRSRLFIQPSHMSHLRSRLFPCRLFPCHPTESCTFINLFERILHLNTSFDNIFP